MKNVLIVTGRYPPDHSGAGLRIVRTYAFLNRAYGVQAKVIAEPIRGDDSLPDRSDVAARVSLEQPIFFIFLSVWRILWRYRRSIDLVHCVGLTYMTAFAALFCRVMRIPHVCELTVDHDIEMRRSFFRNLFLKFFFVPDGAIALTPRIAKSFAVYGCPIERIFLRPNPVQMNEVSLKGTDQSLLSEIQNLRCSKKHLVFGRICHRKNQKGALKILRDMPSEHGLVIAGPLIEEAGKAYYHDLLLDIEALNMKDRVIVYPHHVGNPTALYESVTALWSVSDLEGLPNVILEALWAGRPCFVRQDLQLDGYIIHRDNGASFDMGRPDDAARTIMEFMQSGYDSKAIQEKARSDFSPDIINKKTYDFLNAVAERRDDLPL